jgi:hypothetical protein
MTSDLHPSKDITNTLGNTLKDKKNSSLCMWKCCCLQSN